MRQTNIVLLVTTWLLVWGGNYSSAQVFLENSFAAGLGTLNGIGFDSDTNTIYVHASFSSTIEMFDITGTNVGSFPDPGQNGNDSDYFFSDVDTNVGGTFVPNGSLLIVEHESGIAQLIAADATTGAVLATQDLEFVTGRLVGGTFSSASGSFFAVDYISDVVYEFVGATGELLNTIPVGDGFDVFYGDIEYNPFDGNLYIVSDSQGLIRVIDTSGNLIVDLDVGIIGVSGMSGISFDFNTGNAWICSTNGSVYQASFSTYVIAPETFSVTQGTYASGELADIRTSDNSDLSIRRSTTDILSRTEFVVESLSPFSSPGSIQILLEGSVFARTDVNQSIDLYDFDSGSWVELDSQNASRFVDQEYIVDATGELTRFVSGENLLRARVRFRSTNPRVQFSSNTDRLSWIIANE